MQVEQLEVCVVVQSITEPHLRAQHGWRVRLGTRARLLARRDEG